MDLTTRVIQGSGLSIPIFDGAYRNGKGRYLSEPELIKNSLLEQMFEPEELQSLLLVKSDHRHPDAHHLRARTFADGMERRLTFSSGNSYYFADAELRRKIRRLFATEPDAACRYGSLLVSNCYKGSDTLENLRVKLVDFNEPEFARYRTGDCHGKISPRLADQLGGDRNCPFQFRFAWRRPWAAGREVNSPRVSFLSKGTLLPDAHLTDAEGYDLIMDRSSIKGIKKVRLDELLPCGDYEFPKAAMGNRGNARATSYDNSWQFTIWYSENAVRQDLSQPTQEKARVLAELQRNPLALARYIVQQYDQEQQRRQERSEEEFEDLDNNTNSQIQESRWISLLRSDQYGQLVETPKFCKFATDYVAGRWRDLAIKSGYTHSSGMAMPADDLPRGTICVPHLPEGDVILTRYPIVNSDNIRLYHNVHNPELTKTRNVVWINPRDAEDYHQADFDGDQLMVSSASQLPHIARETLRAGEPGRFAAVKQRSKRAYTEVLTQEGDSKYQTFAQIAAAVNQNKVGLVATNIGRVQSSMPQEGENPGRFDRRQRTLLNRLFQALQVEVDSPKSAERLEDIQEIAGETLLSDAKRWSESHPSPFFDFKKDDRLYKRFAMPAEAPGSLTVLAREVVNPLWEPTRIRSRDRHEFRYLFPKDDVSVDALEWAEELKIRFQHATDEIQERVGNDRDAFNEELGKLYDSYRAEIKELFPTPEERFEGAAALWYTQHTRPEMDRHRRECLALAKQLDITFTLQHGYEVPSEARSRDAYILSVPFGSDAIRWKQTLEQKGIAFDATIHPQLPMIEFALKDIPPRLIGKLEAKFGSNVNDLDTLSVPDDLRIIPPADHSWAESRQDSGVGALAYNLFTEEVCQQLQTFQFDEIKILGIRHNDFAGENFASRQWRDRTVRFQVGVFELPESHPEYYRYHGTPIVQIDDKNLGTFSPDTPKLPIGSSFEANLRPEGSSVVLKLNPDSIQLPESVLLDAELVHRTDANRQEWRKEMVAGLMAAIGATYEQQCSGESEVTQFRVGNWTAYVQPTGDFLVRNEGRRTICRGNLYTGEETVPLSEDAADELERMLLERERSHIRGLEKTVDTQYFSNSKSAELG